MKKGKILYSHNCYKAKRPIEDSFEAGCNMLEADVVYLNDKVMLSHGWVPFECMCHGELEEVFLKPLFNMAVSNNLPKNFWLYVEIKTGDLDIVKPLYRLLRKYKHKKINLCMSVQDRYPTQKCRAKVLAVFMENYKEELNILNKKTELPEKYEISDIDVYEKTLWDKVRRQATLIFRKLFERFFK